MATIAEAIKYAAEEGRIQWRGVPISGEEIHANYKDENGVLNRLGSALRQTMGHTDPSDQIHHIAKVALTTGDSTAALAALDALQEASHSPSGDSNEAQDREGYGVNRLRAKLLGMGVTGSKNDAVIRGLVNDKGETFTDGGMGSHADVIDGILSHPLGFRVSRGKIVLNQPRAPRIRKPKTPAPESPPAEPQQFSAALANFKARRLARAVANAIPGGKGDKLRPADVDDGDLDEGVKVEMEHTHDEKIAREIALDHLAEDRNYYKKLRKIEPHKAARAIKFAAGDPLPKDSNTDHLLHAIEPKAWRANPYVDRTPRLATADHFDELGRHDEAKLLRNLDKHLYLEDGQVKDAQDIADERQAISRRPGHGAAANLPSDERQYLQTALWASNDETDDRTGGDPLDANFTVHDIHPATMAAMLADWRHFKSTNEQTLWTQRHDLGDDREEEYDPESRAPGDFWLTRNGHGAGFQDHDAYYGGNSHLLADAAQRHGEYDLYVGDDGMIHGSYAVQPTPETPENELPDYSAQDRRAEDDFRNHRLSRAVKRYAEADAGPDPEEVSFHQAMAANPADMTNPLVYADWLEEHGRSAEAMIIRSHIDDHNYSETWRAANGYESRHPVHIEDWRRHGFGERRGRPYMGHEKFISIGHSAPSYQADIGRDLFSLYMPMLDGTERYIRFAGWHPRHESHAIIDNADATGVRIDSREDRKNIDSTRWQGPENPDPQQFARAIRTLAGAPYGAPEQYAARIRKDINGQPYVMTEHEEGWTVTAASAATDNFHRSYQVRVEGGQPVSCNCPDHVYRKRVCKHMQAVAEMGQQPGSDAPQQLARAIRMSTHGELINAHLASGDDTAMLALADHMEEAGTPGAHLVRAGVKAKQEWWTPNDTRNFTEPFYVGFPDDPDPANPDDVSAILRVGGLPNEPRIQARFYPPQGEWRANEVTHQIPVRSHAHLRELIKDLHPEIQARIVRAFGNHLPATHEEPTQYAAYRAPKGGIAVRGSFYKGGKMIPDMTGAFMNPPKRKPKGKPKMVFDPAKLERVRANYKPKVKRVKWVPGQAESDGGVMAYARAVRSVFQTAPDNHEGHLDQIGDSPESIYPAIQYADWLAANGDEEAAEIISRHARDKQRDKSYGLSGIHDPDAVVAFPADKFSVSAATNHYTGEATISMKRAYASRPGTVMWKTRVPAEDADRLMGGMKSKGHIVSYDKRSVSPTHLARAIRFSARDHKAFLTAIRQQPEDSTARAVYADYLEEHYPHMLDPEGKTLEFLRTHQGPAWVQHGRDGKVHAGRKYTMQEIRDEDAANGGHWFSRDTMRYFGTRLHGEPIHGPGGIFFVTSDWTGFDRNRRGYTIRQYVPNLRDDGSSKVGTARGEQMTGHRDITSARQRARELAASVPEAPQQMARAVRRMARMSGNLTNLFRAARENPYDETLHGAIADAIEEEHPGSPFPELIRKQFPTLSGTGEGANNLWYEKFENSWDGTFPYAARLGSHGPFDLYLNHEGYVDRDSSVPSTNQRWVLHAVVRPNRGDWVGYSFEIPHERAHEIPRMIPAANKYVSPHTGNRRVFAPPYPGAPNAIPTDYEESIWRSREARRFTHRMDSEERERQSEYNFEQRTMRGPPQDEGG